MSRRYNIKILQKILQISSCACVRCTVLASLLARWSFYIFVGGTSWGRIPAAHNLRGQVYQTIHVVRVKRLFVPSVPTAFSPWLLLPKFPFEIRQMWPHATCLIIWGVVSLAEALVLGGCGVIACQMHSVCYAPLKESGQGGWWQGVHVFHFLIVLYEVTHAYIISIIGLAFFWHQ